MVSLTPEMAGNSLVVLGISYVVIIVFYIYSLYLNWKQSKVSNQMTELIDEVRQIRTLLDKRVIENEKSF